MSLRKGKGQPVPAMGVGLGYSQALRAEVLCLPKCHRAGILQMMPPKPPHSSCGLGTGILPIHSEAVWLFDAKTPLSIRNFLFLKTAPREERCTQQTQLSGLLGQHKSKNTTPWVPPTLLETGCSSQSMPGGKTCIDPSTRW